MRSLMGALDRAGKLEALEYVRTLYGVPKERCVAAGDSGNDILMLEGEVSIPPTLPPAQRTPTIFFSAMSIFVGYLPHYVSLPAFP